MSRHFADAVERYIAQLKNRQTRSDYKRHLRALFRALEGRDAATDRELVFYPYNRISEWKVREALERMGYKSVNQAVSVYRGIIQHLVSRGLLELQEAVNLIEDRRIKGADWTTQWIPVDAVLPEQPSTHPYADTSRWYQSEIRRYPAAVQQESSKAPQNQG